MCSRLSSPRTAGPGGYRGCSRLQLAGLGGQRNFRPRRPHGARQLPARRPPRGSRSRGLAGGQGGPGRGRRRSLARAGRGWAGRGPSRRRSLARRCRRLVLAARRPLFPADSWGCSRPPARLHPPPARGPGSPNSPISASAHRCGQTRLLSLFPPPLSLSPFLLFVLFFLFPHFFFTSFLITPSSYKFHFLSTISPLQPPNPAKRLDF